MGSLDEQSAVNRPKMQPQPLTHAPEQAVSRVGRVKVNVVIAPKTKKSAKLPTVKSADPDSTAERSANPAKEPGPKVQVWVGGGKPRRDRPTPVVEPQQGVDEIEDDQDRWEEDDWPDAPEGSVRLLVSSDSGSRRSPLAALMALVLWLGSGSFVAVSGWVAFWLIVNPGQVGWVSRFFPDWTLTPLNHEDAPKTLEELQTEARSHGQFFGSPIALTADAKATDAADQLFPVMGYQPRCSPTPDQPCTRLEELRVYRPVRHRRMPQFQLVDRLAVSGPDEFFAVSPLADVAPVGHGSSRALPLMSVQRIEGTSPDSGIWFHVNGDRGKGSQRILYGHVGRYDPTWGKLALVLPWTSPAGQPPRWQAITGGGLPELVVNQTIGLEPQFLVYHVKAVSSLAKPVQLEQVSLQQTAFKHKGYENALFLARNRLWTPALQILKAIKPTMGQKWTATAQAQLDVIGLHAAVTKTEAERSRASISQQIVAQMIDGRWHQALTLVRKALGEGHDLSLVLKGHSNRLWQRIEASLRVNPNQVDVQTLGGLMIYAQRGRNAAIDWLQTQNRSPLLASANPSIHPRTQAILQQLDNSPIALGALPQTSGQLMGSTVRLGSVTASEWTTPTNAPLPTLPTGQGWYRVQVSRFHDGQQWQGLPLAQATQAIATPRFLWHLLGLNQNATLQLITWDDSGTPQTTEATVQAIRVHNGVVHLLATGNALSSGGAIAPLAYTTLTLRWLDNPEVTTLGFLRQQQPELATQLTARLRQELQWEADAATTLVAQTDGQDLSQPFDFWSMQQMDVTGNGQPDLILTVRPDMLAVSEVAPVSEAEAPGLAGPPQTLIFSDAGQMIYSEVSRHAGQQLMAIADLHDGEAPSLVVRTRGGYQFQRWSAQRQRFE